MGAMSRPPPAPERSTPRLAVPGERAEATLEALLDAVVDGIILIDARGRIAGLNRAAERIFGYPVAELLGRNVSVLMPSPYREQHDGYLASYLATGERKIIGIGREVVGLRRDGSTFPLDLAVGEAWVGSDRLFTGVVRDLTDRKRLEEQLLQAQKMEAVGQLAGGVAHDFNNLLAVIQGSSERLLETLPAGDRNRRAAERISQAAERGARLTGQLLAFSRRDVSAPGPVDVNQELGGMRDLLGRLIGEDIEIKLDLGAASSTVVIDRTHLDQVLMNLAVNAGDAMPAGGRLRIATRTVTFDGGDAAATPGVRPGRYVALIVEDTGTGIDPVHLPRLFDPFFTTKEPGRGTGLGLSTVHAIVSRSGGAISVHSRVGEGSRFEIYLPAATKAGDAGEPSAPTRRTRGSGVILLVEDDDLLRELLSEALEDEGYTVRVAASPDEALLLARSAGAVDLLLTDVVMPGMTGDELAERLRRMHRGLPVLFMSGYADSRVAARSDLSGSTLIRKPFSTSALAEVVAQALARRG
jgi:PAS domain S-box-containing protein